MAPSTDALVTLIGPAKWVYEMLCRAANGQYTRAVEAIDAELDVDRQAAWDAYCARIDAIAERSRRRKLPHRQRYLQTIHHAREQYEAALTELRARLLTES